MVGGKIVDHYTVEGKTKFLVKGDESKTDHCCVTAEIPKEILGHGEIQSGDTIWWQGQFVMLTIFGVDDTQFKKIGASGGDVQSFYNGKRRGALAV